MQNSFWTGIKKSLGPGLIMAAAAIGVSHLVQSTRAGAEFGFALVWAVLLANIFKYPFLEFGPRYAMATGQTMIEGYARMHRLALWIFILFTVSTMFVIHAAVTLVTASLATNLTGIDLPIILWAGIILGISISILFRGRYSFLNVIIKFLMVVLAVSTLVAVIAAISGTQQQPAAGFIAPQIWNTTGIAFLIALMGWMPIPIDAAAWHSIWSVEQVRDSRYKPKLHEVLFDFNLGYIGASAIALCFLTLGSIMLYGSGVEFAVSAADFSNQLIQLYTDSLGNWSGWIIIIAAFSTMFSTTLSVTDIYPRVISHFIQIYKSEGTESSIRSYRILLVAISTGTLLMLIFIGEAFRFLIDFAATMSFLTAPVLAFMNHKLIHREEVSPELRPKPWLYWLSIAGIIFLTLFAFIYLFWMFLY